MFDIDQSIELSKTQIRRSVTAPGGLVEVGDDGSNVIACLRPSDG